MFASIKKIFGGKSENKNKAAPSGLAGSGFESSDGSTNPAIRGTRPSEMDSDQIPTHAPSDKVATTAPVDLPPPSPNELKLEALFAHAAHEAGKRNDFLAALMAAELFVVGQADPAENGAMNIQLATQVANEEPVALAFTSLAAMSQAGAPGGQPSVKIKGQDMTRMIRGQLGFVLNPGNRVAKHFSKWEVEQLAGGPAQTAGVREVPMPDSNAVSIGQPAQYPKGLRELLKTAATEMVEITAIHTGLMSVSETEPPVLLAVISTAREHGREEFLALVNQLGTRTSSLGPVPLNFAPMNPNFLNLVEKRALIDVGEMLS